jgi:hypothetical protein
VRCTIVALQMEQRAADIGHPQAFGCTSGGAAAVDNNAMHE